jgi:hypothetical protein
MVIMCLLATCFTATACETGAYRAKIQDSNAGTGTFALGYKNLSSGLEQPGFEPGDSCTEIEGGDINGDGYIELISVGDHGNPGGTPQNGLEIWYYDGSSKWTLDQPIPGFGYGGVAVGDVNNDGKMDTGWGVHHNYGTPIGSKLIDCAIGDGTGKGWTAWDNGLASMGEYWGMFGTDFGDIDNDGWLDVGSVSFGLTMGAHSSNGCQIYRNNHDGTWTNKGIGFDQKITTCIQFGDVNADGYLDVSVCWLKGHIFLGNGKGVWALWDSGIPSCSGSRLGDVDNDGDLDLSYCTQYGSEYVVQVATWDGTSKTWKNSSSGLPTTGQWWPTELADMNNDGNIDLLAGSDTGIQVYLGDGTGKWTKDVFIPIGGGSCRAVRVVGDIDHNGYNDIAGIYGEPVCFLNDKPATTLSAFVQSPRGGEFYYPGGVRFIDWTSSVPSGGPGTAKLELSSTGNSGPWTTIVDGVPNNGRYQWTVPDVTSKDCYVKVTVTAGGNSASAVNLRPFEIKGSGVPPPPPSVNVQISIPNGGENWTVGTSHDIKWIASGGTGSLLLKLEYSSTGSGGLWTVIANGLPNSGSYTWLVPNASSYNCYVKATATDGASPPVSGSDVSNSNFTIYPASGPPPPPPAPVISHVTITPSSASMMIGDTKPFTARTFLTDGSEITNSTVSWALSGSIGTVSPPAGYSTTITATAAGSGSLSASAVYQGKTVTNQSPVSVHTPPPPIKLTTVEITPKSIWGTKNEQFFLEAKAYDNQHIEIASGISYAWEVVGSFGTISPSTGPSVKLVATSEGTGQVKVTASLNSTSVTNTSDVSITLPGVVIDKLVLNPVSISGSVGQSYTIEAKAYDADGKDITTETVFSWSMSNAGITRLSSTSGSKITVSLKSAGSATVYVEASCGGEYKDGSVPVKSSDPAIAIPMWLIFAVIGVIAAMIALILLAGRRKKKKREQQSADHRYAQPQEPPVQQPYPQPYPQPYQGSYDPANQGNYAGNPPPQAGPPNQ